MWPLLALMVVGAVVSGCYNNNTGETNIGGAINFTLPAFPETGSNAIQIFTEMHYQPSYRAQEGPRLLPPEGSVPVSGRELKPTSLEEYAALSIPERFKRSYDPAKAQELFNINCMVCHGPTLRGSEETDESVKAKILRFMPRSPLPANLTLDVTRTSADGELFGFISGGGRQGLVARLRGRESSSPMPEFGRLLTEEERWTLVQFLRSKIGQ